LLIATLIALAALIPLVLAGGEVSNGDWRSLPTVIVLSWYWIPGLALLWNIVRSARFGMIVPQDEEGEEADEPSAPADEP
jgi:hypothetical protein